MYRTSDGEEIFIVDGHVHFWDGSPANQKNRYAEGWVECFYNYHKNLSPAEVNAIVAFLSTMHPHGEPPARDSARSSD